MKTSAWIILMGFVASLLMGCIVAHPRMAPPPHKKEIKPIKPGADFVWISGHWKWTGARYVWVRGHWAKPPKGKAWVPGHWKKKGPRWVWVPGHWRKK